MGMLGRFERDGKGGKERLIGRINEFMRGKGSVHVYVQAL